MYTAKESSTNLQNKQMLLDKCPVTYTLERIGGRWKALILYHLSNKALRYSELKRALPTSTEKMLIQQLKELEADKLLLRDVKPVVPPHVTYSLTDAGMALKPVLQAMATWGLIYSADTVFNDAETATLEQ
jgi:DNA-binding HxlR family transcriptional regulator